MRWKELLHKLTTAQGKLPRQWDEGLLTGEQNWALHLSELRKFLGIEEEGVKASIRAYARSEEWPRLNSNEVLFLHWRLEAAQEATEYLAFAETTLGLSASDLGEEELFEWALIELWWERTYPATHRKLEALARAYSRGVQGNTSGTNPESSE